MPGLATWSAGDVTWDSLTSLWDATAPPRGPTPTSLTICVWEPVGGTTWQKIHEIRTWTTVAIEPRYLDPGVWSLTMPYNTQAAALAEAHESGGLQMLTFDLVRDEGTQRLMTGVLLNIGPGAGETGGVVMEASGVGALGLLAHAECWPSPDFDLSEQRATHYTATGATETVLRNLIAGNLPRYYDVQIPASAGRGKTITLKERFSNLLTVTMTRCRQANLGLRMDLVRSTSGTRAMLKLEFFTPANVSQRVRLSHDVGSLRSWKQTDIAPTATRAVIGGSVKMTPLGIEFINTDDNRLTTTTNTHTLQTGAKMVVTGGPLPGGLSAGTTYYVIRYDADTIKVAESRTKALKGTEINLTTLGMRIEKVNITPNAITITRGDVPETGARIRVIGGDLPNPLLHGDPYWSIKVDRDTFKVASSLANAEAGTAINLTTDGTGALYVYEAGSVQIVEVARVFRQVIDNPAEAKWGFKIEVFVDASGEDLDDMDELLERGREALKEMTAQSGFELEAVESEGVRYGIHFDLGDTVAIELMTGLSRTDQLNAVQIEGGSGGINVKLIPGLPDAGSPLFRQADIIRRLRRELRALQREEG